ncbi:hypothetical protein G7054_g6171 [Neopestalotiopsis clavispora]|nr:hypothetical protein G7054_g6171 [Neopestalotiopsis clavispora]
MDIGLQEVYSPSDGVEAVANICFVHGLFGGPWKSFSAKRQTSDAEPSVQTPNGSSTKQDTPNKKPEKKVFWPRELLPLSVNNVSIFTFGYDADIGKFMGAAGLNKQTPESRRSRGEAEALNQSATSTDSKKNRVLGYTRGIIFLGTPHHGSSAATYGRAAFRLGKTVAFQSANIKLLTALERNSESLDQLSTEFCETLEKANSLRMWSFSEEKQVRFGVVGMQIVPADSARIRHIKEDWGSISGDHRQIAKYASTRDDGFRKVSDVLKGWVRDIERDPQRNLSLSEEYKECLKTLDDPDARLRVQEVHQVSQTGSGSFEWLFTDQVPFSKWLQDDTDKFGPVFWITGRPGSGKSTLMRFALEDKRTIELLPESIGHPLAYFFHLRGKSTVQKSLGGMLKELLHQLLWQFPHFYSQIGPIYKRRVSMLDSRNWDLDSLTEGFLQIPKFIPSSQRTRDRVFLFIDALDENENQEENETMMKLIKRLSSEYESMEKRPNSPLLKICLASRSWPLFEKELGGSPRIPSFAIHNFTTDDIRIYASALLEGQLQKLEPPAAHQSDSQQLVSEIIVRANGVFVWVRVVVDSLRRHITDGTPIEVLRKKVLEYPKELNELYEYTVKRIPEDYWKELEVALKVLFSSQTALTLTELYVITRLCTIERPEDSPADSFQASQQTSAWLASRSGGLIEEINISPTFGDDLDQQQADTISSVQFIHQTVQDFVRTGIRGLPEPSERGPRLPIPPGHHLITLACLRPHPPHPCVSRVTQKVFMYFRACESDWDADLDVTYIDERLPWSRPTLIRLLWDSFSFFYLNGYQGNDYIRFFMDEVDRAKVVQIIAELHGENLSADKVLEYIVPTGQREANALPETLSVGGKARDNFIMHRAVQAFSTMNGGQPLDQALPKTHGSSNSDTRPVRARLRKAIRGIMALRRCNDQVFYTTMLILQNLYHPNSAYFGMDNQTNWYMLALLAAVGQRLAEDRTDRPRMLKKVLQESFGPIFSGRRILEAVQNLKTPSSAILDVQPAPEIIWESSNTPLAIVMTALPSAEITDTILRYMAEIILEYCGRHWGYLGETVRTRLPHRSILSLVECCAMFKGQEAKAWLQLLSNYKSRIGWYYGNIVVRSVFLRMGLKHEEEIPEMRHGIVFPGVIATASRGLSLRYLCQGFRDPEENHGE